MYLSALQMVSAFVVSSIRDLRPIEVCSVYHQTMWGVGRTTRCGLSSHHCFGSVGGPCTALTQCRVRGRDIAGYFTSTLLFQRRHDACPCKLRPSRSSTSCTTLMWLASFASVSQLHRTNHRSQLRFHHWLAGTTNDKRFGLGVSPSARQLTLFSPRMIPRHGHIVQVAAAGVDLSLPRLNEYRALDQANTTSHAPYQRSKAAGPHSADSCQGSLYQNGSLRTNQRCKDVECFENVSISAICKLWFRLSLSCQPYKSTPATLR